MASKYLSDDKVQEILQSLDWFPLFREGWLDPELRRCSGMARALLMELMVYGSPYGGRFRIDKGILLAMFCRMDSEESVIRAWRELISCKRICVQGDIDHGEVEVEIKRLIGVMQAQVLKVYDSWTPRKQIKREASNRGRSGGRAKSVSKKAGLPPEPKAMLENFTNRRERCTNE